VTPEACRDRFRSGEWTGPTSGLALGHLQANLVVLPAEAAGEFGELCRANPRPLPQVDVTEPGDPVPSRVAPGAVAIRGRRSLASPRRDS